MWACTLGCERANTYASLCLCADVLPEFAHSSEPIDLLLLLLLLVLLVLVLVVLLLLLLLRCASRLSLYTRKNRMFR